LGNVACQTDPGGSRILVDLGNALPIDATGNVAQMGAIHLVACKHLTDETASLAPGDFVDLGALTGYTAAGFYLKTAGIRAFPPDVSLNAAQRQALDHLPLAIVQGAGAGQRKILAAEAPDGIYARADMFVCRINPGESQTLSVLVTRFGQPLAGQVIKPKISNASIGKNQGGKFDASIPASALNLVMSGPTGSDGRASLTITGSDPGRPRHFLDGQIYEIDLSVTGAAMTGTAFDSSQFISVLLFSQTDVPDTVTWTGNVLPILQQYANLYPRPHGAVVNYDPHYPGEPNPAPLLHPVISLTDQDWVASYATRILAALALPVDHPNHMPVTRDLSAGRRGILSAWMRQVIAGTVVDQPLATAAVAAGGPAPRLTQGSVMHDSKTAAMLRIKSGGHFTRDAE
jgi:hypothetical protein